MAAQPIDTYSGNNSFASDLSTRLATGQLPSTATTEAENLLSALGLAESDASGGGGGGSAEADDLATVKTDAQKLAVSLEQSGATTASTDKNAALDQSLFDAEALGTQASAEMGQDSQGKQIAALFHSYCVAHDVTKPTSTTFDTFAGCFGSASTNNADFKSALAAAKASLFSTTAGHSHKAATDYRASDDDTSNDTGDTASANNPTNNLLSNTDDTSDSASPNDPNYPTFNIQKNPDSFAIEYFDYGLP